MKKEDIKSYKEKIKQMNNNLISELNKENIDIKKITIMVMSYKLELSNMFSDAMSLKNHYKKIIDKIEIHKESIVNKIKSTKSDEKMNSETKKSYSIAKAEEIISENLFDGEAYPTKMSQIISDFSDSEELYVEIKTLINILSNIMIGIGILNKNEINGNVKIDINNIGGIDG